MRAPAARTRAIAAGQQPLNAHLSVARRSANTMSMNLRHAAALALVGWYLMVPPVVCEKGKCTAELNAPFSQWHRSRKSAGSESNCEEARPKVRAAVDK